MDNCRISHTFGPKKNVNHQNVGIAFVVELADK